MTKVKSIFSAVILINFILAMPGQGMPQTEPATVEGIVVVAGTTTPVPRAHVVLGNTGNAMTVTADDEGHFVFSSVPPASYSLVATHAGYVVTTYVPPGAGLILAPKQSLKDVTLSMIPTGSISGRVKNSFGEPVGNATVRAQRVAYQPGGQRILNSVLSVRTDDLGDYRLYFLEPGRYVVNATPPSGSDLGTTPGSPLAGRKNANRTPSASELAALGIVTAASTGEIYPTVYFPGTTDLSTATPIELRPGTSIDGTDFVVNAIGTVRVRGQVLNLRNGLPVTLSMIARADRNGVGVKVDGTVSESGTFEFRGVAPGSYELVATQGELSYGTKYPGPPGGAILSKIQWSNPATAGSSPASPRLAATTAIEVGNRDLTDVMLSLGSGYTINGRILVDGLPPGESDLMTAGVGIQLIPSRELLMIAPPPSVVGMNGGFAISGVVPGDYIVAITQGDQMPSGSYVKSVLFNGADAINPRLVIPSDPRGQLDIALGATLGKVAASVVGANEVPANNATVILIPDSPQRQHYELYKIATTNASGHASMMDFIPGVVPGDYTAYALENAEDGVWWDPAFPQKFENSGKRVHVDAGSTQTINLKILPR